MNAKQYCEILEDGLVESFEEGVEGRGGGKDLSAGQ
jgi:hypothetical protein